MYTLRTRRSFILKLALASTVLTVVATGIALPASKSKPVVSQQTRTLLEGVASPGFARTVHADSPTQMVGFTWKGAQPGTVELRVKKDGKWSGWEEVEGSPAEGPDSTSKEYRGVTSAGPVWVGNGVDDVQMRVQKGNLSGLRMHSIRTEVTSKSGISSASANPPQPFIITRPAWGADESWRSYASGCNGQPDYANTVRYAVFHHTDNSNNYGPGDSAAIVRGIYYFHTHNNGWCDVGYNFLVDRFGQIFEGRYGGVAAAVIGAHAGGFNTESTGVAVIGNFQGTPVPQAAYDSVRRLLAWKLALTHVNPTAAITVTAGSFSGSRYPAGSQVQIWTIAPHRDLDYTDCPGDTGLGALPPLRRDVQATMAGAVHSWPAIARGNGWYLKNSYTSGAADTTFTYGETGDIPLFGDWNGDGIRTPGVYRPSNAWFYLKNSFGPGPGDISFPYGNLGDQPVVGDWNNDGITTVGVVRNTGAAPGQKWWYLRNSHTTGNADITFTYGYRTDVPLVGDWNGDGIDTPGVQRGNNWYFKNSNASGAGDISFSYGNVGDYSIVGDWDSNGTDTPGVVRGSTWYLRNSDSPGPGDISFNYGFGPAQGDLPRVW